MNRRESFAAQSEHYVFGFDPSLAKSGFKELKVTLLITGGNVF